ncbi:MAG: zinc ribbon domain-containing protein, partial [Christensenellaceae bacterium]
DTVQAEIKRRKSIGRPSSCTSPFSTKIICECCGGYYGSKVWGSNTKYKYTIWRCNDKYKGDSKCKTPHFTEDELKARFVAAFNQLIDVRDELIADIGIAKIALCDNSKMALEIVQLESEMEVAAELSRKIIFENAQMIMNQTEFNAKNDEYLKRYKQANDKITELTEKQRKQKAKALLLDRFALKLQAQSEVIEKFDIDLWTATIHYVTATKTGKLIFVFKDGTKIES